MSRRVQPGDFLLTNSMSFGRPYIMKTDGCIHDGWLVLRDESGRLDPDYLYHFLGSDAAYRQFDALAAGSTVRNLNTDLVKRVRVVVPPLAEQRRIVAILDEAFAEIRVAVANTEQARRAAKEVIDCEVHAILEEAAGLYPSIELGGIVDILDSRRRPITKIDRQVGPYPYYGATGIQDYIAGYLFEEPLVLLGEDGAKWGRGDRSAFAVSGRVWVNNHAHVLRPRRDRLTDSWLIYALNSLDLTPYISGVTVPKLNQAKMREIVLPIPPLARQVELVERLDRVVATAEELVRLYGQKLAALAELKQSLLARAFSGELTSANDNAFANPMQTANVMALVHWHHEKAHRAKTYGHVKAQKGLHLLESTGRVNLGRNPIKDAAGPNDFAHMKAAEAWAKEKAFFEFVQRDGGYDFKKLANYGKLLAAAKDSLRPIQSAIERVSDLIVPLDTEGAEALATVHAAWNNLLVDKRDPTREAIIREAREDWGPSKAKFSDGDLLAAIKLIEAKGIVPDGSAKPVRHLQLALL